MRVALANVGGYRARTRSRGRVSCLLLTSSADVRRVARVGTRACGVSGASPGARAGPGGARRATDAVGTPAGCPGSAGSARAARRRDAGRRKSLLDLGWLTGAARGAGSMRADAAPMSTSGCGRGMARRAGREAAMPRADGVEGAGASHVTRVSPASAARLRARRTREATKPVGRADQHVRIPGARRVSFASGVEVVNDLHSHR